MVIFHALNTPILYQEAEKLKIGLVHVVPVGDVRVIVDQRGPAEFVAEQLDRRPLQPLIDPVGPLDRATIAGGLAVMLAITALLFWLP